MLSVGIVYRSGTIVFKQLIDISCLYGLSVQLIGDISEIAEDQIFFFPILFKRHVINQYLS